MNILPLVEALPRIASSFTLDDSSLGLIGMLVGMGGGWYLTVYREQIKAKKAKIRVETEEELRRRKSRQQE